MMAAQEGETETAEVLLREGADGNVQTKVRIATFGSSDPQYSDRLHS